MESIRVKQAQTHSYSYHSPPQGICIVLELGGAPADGVRLCQVHKVRGEDQAEKADVQGRYQLLWNENARRHHTFHVWIFMKTSRERSPPTLFFVSFQTVRFPFDTDEPPSDPHDPCVSSVVSLPAPPPTSSLTMLPHLRQPYNGIRACSGLQQLHSRA